MPRLSAFLVIAAAVALSAAPASVAASTCERISLTGQTQLNFSNDGSRGC